MYASNTRPNTWVSSSALRGMLIAGMLLWAIIGSGSSRSGTRGSASRCPSWPSECWLCLSSATSCSWPRRGAVRSRGGAQRRPHQPSPRSDAWLGTRAALLRFRGLWIFASAALKGAERPCPGRGEQRARFLRERPRFRNTAWKTSRRRASGLYQQARARAVPRPRAAVPGGGASEPRGLWCNGPNMSMATAGPCHNGQRSRQLGMPLCGSAPPGWQSRPRSGPHRRACRARVCGPPMAWRHRSSTSHAVRHRPSLNLAPSVLSSMRVC